MLCIAENCTGLSVLSHFNRTSWSPPRYPVKLCIGSVCSAVIPGFGTVPQYVQSIFYSISMCTFKAIFSMPEKTPCLNTGIVCGRFRQMFGGNELPRQAYGVGDFACGDQLTQLERGRTESPARSCFCDAKHRTIKTIFFKMNNPGAEHTGYRGFRLRRPAYSAGPKQD